MSVSKEKDVAAIVQNLVTTDVSGRTTIQLLSEAVNEHQDRTPSLEAAQSLTESIGRDDIVVIATGFPIPPTMRQETDGPPGAVSLARAVSEGLAANPFILCEESALNVCENVARAGELNPVDRETNLDSDHTVTIYPFPIDRDTTQRRAAELVNELTPSASSPSKRLDQTETGNIIIVLDTT